MTEGGITTKAKLAIVEARAKNAEALALMMGVELNNLKQRIRALELDSHPPVNLKAALNHLGVETRK